jgi:hypothetical protein
VPLQRGLGRPWRAGDPSRTARAGGGVPRPHRGAELGKALAALPDDIEAALTEYEQAMFPRSAEVATFEGAEIHGIDSEDNTAHALINMFTEKGQRATQAPN